MIDYDKLLKWRFPEVEHRLTTRDTILYALGVGFGDDPLDRDQLRFVYEQNLLAVPSMAAILCFPGNWLRDPATGVDYGKQVNAGNKLEIHGLLPVDGTLVSTPRVVDIIDKGVNKGALVITERKVFDKAGGRAVCTVTTNSLCRGDGGFGGPPRTLPATPRPPDTPPDRSVEIATARNLALIYRLNGDQNPLHVDPEFARAAGYPQPILHGLATLGIATHALLKACCAYDPARLTGIEVRYTSPVFPGDLLRTDIWFADGGARFRVVAANRGPVVIDGGSAQIAENRSDT